MDNYAFEQLLSKLTQETSSTQKKLEYLFNSRGFFTGLQASRVLYTFAAPPDKLNAMRVMTPRLCRMTCGEARDVLCAVSVVNDRLEILNLLKRFLLDAQTRDGVEEIIWTFPFEEHKMKALGILNTVRSDVANHVPAGGHQGYAALGGLYTQCRPLVPHLYGSLEQQRKDSPGGGTIELPAEAKFGVLPSLYTSHPSYACAQGRDYAEDRGYPGNAAYQGCPAKEQ